MFPGVLTVRSVLATVKNTDERIKTWPGKLEVLEVVPETKGKYVQEQLPHARTALAKFNEGKVGFAQLTDQHVH